VYATLPLDQSTVVSTSDGAYLLSPHNPTAFVEAWRVRRPLGPTQRWREEQQWVWPFNLPIWHDRMAWGLVVAGLLINFILHSYLVFIVNRLPDRLPFHFNVLGQADLIASRSEIFRFPGIALLMLVFDVAIGLVIYRRVQMASYLIWAGGILVQLLAGAAVFTIIG
jgi:hypothetical protein